MHSLTLDVLLLTRRDSFLSVSYSLLIPRCFYLTVISTFIPRLTGEITKRITSLTSLFLSIFVSSWIRYFLVKGFQMQKSL